MKTHYIVYIPEDYNLKQSYPICITLPSYEELYFQLVSVNLKCKVFASETKKINIQMII